jgi:hypothetical protein
MSSTSGQSFEKTVQSIIESTGISSLDYLDASFKLQEELLMKSLLMLT